MTNDYKTVGEKLLVFFDYEGTIGTSIRRHYIQYVEALERISKQLELGNEIGLEPISLDNFLKVYPKLKHIGHLLPVDCETLEGRVAQALLQRQHLEIIWEYNPAHMEYEEIIPGVFEALQLLLGCTHGVIVSYTKQPRLDFIQHLSRFDIVGDNMLNSESIYTVGADGKDSKRAKAEIIRSSYGDQISFQKESGVNPILVGDSVSDMKAAFEVGLDFVGITSTGKSNASEFQTCFKELSLSHSGLAMNLFSSLSNEDCITFIASEAKKFQHATQRKYEETSSSGFVW